MSSLINHIHTQNGFQAGNARTKPINGSRFWFCISRFATHLIQCYNLTIGMSLNVQTTVMYNKLNFLKNIQISAQAKCKLSERSFFLVSKVKFASSMPSPLWHLPCHTHKCMSISYPGYRSKIEESENNPYSPHSRDKLNNLQVAYGTALFVSGCGVTYQGGAQTMRSQGESPIWFWKRWDCGHFCSPDAINFLVWGIKCCEYQEDSR